MTITSPNRSALRAGTVAALTSAPLLAVTSAFASSFQGEDAGSRLSVLQTIGIFVGIPVGLFLIITCLVMLPSWIKGDRNRTEIGWDRKSDLKRKAQQESSVKDEAEAKAGAVSGGTGGASGSW